MDCKEIKEMLNALADNEVTDSEREIILSHIAKCEDCRKEYEKLLAIKKEFAKLNVQLKGALADSVMQKISSEVHPKQKKSFFVRHIGTAAAIVIVAWLFIYTRLNPLDMAKEEGCIIPDAPTESVNKSDFNFACGDNESITTDDAFETDEKINTSILKDETVTSDTFLNETPAETEPEEFVEESASEPSASPGTQESESIMSEELPKSEKTPVISDYRFSNSIATDTAIIFVDSEMETVLPLFTNASSIGSNQINVDEHHSDVMKILLSNSITVTSTDIPEGTTETAICVE